ncbi:hypothetical protein MMC20_000895 [Loxospora ochrophaea]|nr:hypothetical protein [Loxospora ochrophaea]
MSAVSESALHKPDMPTGDSKDNTSSALPTRTETKPFERTRSRFKRLVKSAEKQTLSITTKDSKRERTSGREKAQSVPTSGINLPMLDFKAFSPNLEERDAVIDRKTSTSMRNNIEEDQAPGDIDNLDLDSEPTDTMLDIPLENTGSSPIPIQGGNKEFDNISIASLNVNEERTSLMSSSGTSLFDNFAVEYEGVFGELEMET